MSYSQKYVKAFYYKGHFKFSKGEKVRMSFLWLFMVCLGLFNVKQVIQSV